MCLCVYIHIYTQIYTAWNWQLGQSIVVPYLELGHVLRWTMKFHPHPPPKTQTEVDDSQSIFPMTRWLQTSNNSHWLVKCNRREIWQLKWNSHPFSCSPGTRPCQDFTEAMDAVNVDLDEMRARVSCPHFPMDFLVVSSGSGWFQVG